MVQFVNKPHSLAASLGGAVGGGLNNALMQVLENITKNKIQQVEGRQQGFTPQDNSTLQALNLISHPTEQSLPLPAEQPSPSLPLDESSLQKALQTISPQEQFTESAKIKKEPTEPKKKEAPSEKPKGLSKEDRAASQAALKLINKPKKLTPASKIADKVNENPDPIEHKAIEKKQDSKIKKLPKLSEKQQLSADKETKPYFDEISKQAKGAKDGNVRLDRMIELIKDGELNWPSASSFLDTLDRGIPLFGSHIGIDLHFLENKPTHEFRKLSSDFIKGAKDVFGGRVTNLDLESFMRTIPSVTQSDGGKIAVIRNMRLLNAGALVRKKAMDEIISENDGRRPPNLESLVEERASDQLDVLAKKFKEGILEEDEAAALRTARERKILGLF